MTHHPIKSDAPNFKFGTSSRDNVASIGRVVSPGPGAYNHKEVVGKEGSRRSMLGRRPDSAPASRQTPGPAHYSPKREFSAKRNPQFSIGTSIRDGALGLKHQLGTPGPS